MNTKFVILLLLLLIIILLNTIVSYCHATDANDNEPSVMVGNVVHLSNGQIFSYGLKQNYSTKSEELPRWLLLNSDSRSLEGVPGAGDFGTYHIYLLTENSTKIVLNINVIDRDNFCSNFDQFVWMEIIINKKFFSLTTTDKLNIFKKFTENINLNSSSLRIFSESFIRNNYHYETIDSTLYQPIDYTSTVLFVKLYCDIISEDNINVIVQLTNLNESFIESERIIGRKLLKGYRKRESYSHKSVDLLTESTVTTINSSRTSTGPHSLGTKATTLRSIRSSTLDRFMNTPPIRLVSLPTFHCKRGTVCELKIPHETFIDAEDGGTFSLALSVHPLDDDNVNVSKWLFIDKKRKDLRGLPMNEGGFEYRLEARDSYNQIASAAFRVEVKEESATSNHMFTIDVQRDYDEISQPLALYDFALQLSRSLGDIQPNNIKISDVKMSTVPGRALIKWSNSTISNGFCRMNVLNSIKHLMVTKNLNRIRTDFLRSMGSKFNVRDVKLKHTGSCAEKVSNDGLLQTAMSTMIDQRTTTMQALPEMSATITPTLLLLILILLLLVILSILSILIYYAVKQHNLKSVQSEYVSKGLPVVFPEELPQHEESATVSTPMLIKEERPPLTISRTSSNLYKPPPPLSLTSSPRMKQASSTQRLPPAYVPP